MKGGQRPAEGRSDQLGSHTGTAAGLLTWVVTTSLAASDIRGMGQIRRLAHPRVARVTAYRQMAVVTICK